MAVPSSNSPEYNSWESMMQRCYNSNHKQYKNYGGRGIKVQKSWHEFENFYRDMGKRPKGKTLDRKNPNKNYSKGNCIWADLREQARNRRNLNGKMRGVTPKKRESGTKYQAQIKKPGTNELIFIGTYDSKQAAARAFDNKYEKYYGKRPNGTSKEMKQYMEKGDIVYFSTKEFQFVGEVEKVHHEGEHEMLTKGGGMVKKSLGEEEYCVEVKAYKIDEEKGMVEKTENMYKVLMEKSGAVHEVVEKSFSDVIEDYQYMSQRPFSQIVMEFHENSHREKSLDEIVKEYKEKSAPKKYANINFVPPESVAKAAKRGLELREKQPDSNKCCTSVGLARARQLSNRQQLSPSTVKRMYSYFERHEVDKQGEGWGSDSKGYQAWLIWGGDAGYSWVKKIVKQMEAADNKT